MNGKKNLTKQYIKINFSLNNKLNDSLVLFIVQNILPMHRCKSTFV